ncbi:MAG: hypothetical protein AAFZ17_14360 [Cyanobacteria bacterium J06650_10]
MRSFPKIHCLKESHRGSTEVFVLYNKSRTFHLQHQVNTLYPLPESIRQGCIDKNQDLDRYLIAREQYLSIVRKLEDLTIRIIPQQQMGFDGETYHLWLRSGYAESAFTWWSDCPPQWHSLETIFNDIVELTTQK